MENYNYTTYDSSSADPAVGVAILLGILLVYTVFAVALYIVTSIFLAKIFKKAGVPAWIAWVPIYNNWKLLQIGGQQGWWSVLMLVPIVNIVSLVVTYIAMYHVGKKLGKEDWFILIAIFLTPIWVIWLGADSSKWDESKGAPRTDTPALPPAGQAAKPTAGTDQTPPAAPVA